MKRKDNLLKDMTSKSKDLEKQIGNVESETHDLRAQLDGRKETIDQLTKECRYAEEEKAKLDDERRYIFPSSELIIGSYGDLRPRFQLRRIARKTNCEKLNINYTILWTEMFKLV
jgi:septal ring factor EnvC (AmiA/AmiB activator)